MTRLWITAFIVAMVGIIVFMVTHFHLLPFSDISAQPVTVSYVCKANATITATYFRGRNCSISTSGQPPVPNGSVILHISDGRTMTLPQTISADGARYANSDESFVVWSKGNSLMVLENDEEKSFVGCIAVPPSTGVGLNRVYANSARGFSIRLKEGYTPDTTYQYQEMGPGRAIDGVKFTIPASTAQGTNLASDTYFSVEEIPRVEECRASLFLDSEASSTMSMEGETTYSVASTTGAGAGNRYEEIVYALPGTSPCVAVRYFVHYGVIENYMPGAVHEFDKQALIKEFDAIRRTLTLAQ